MLFEQCGVKDGKLEIVATFHLEPCMDANQRVCVCVSVCVSYDLHLSASC